MSDKYEAIVTAEVRQRLREKVRWFQRATDQTLDWILETSGLPAEIARLRAEVAFAESELRAYADRWMSAKGASYPEAQADSMARNDCGNAIDDLLSEMKQRRAAEPQSQGPQP